MHFTYESYAGLLATLAESGYQVVSYHDWQEVERPVILRHDIDTDIDAAVKLARFEHEYTGGVFIQVCFSDRCMFHLLCVAYLGFLQCLFASCPGRAE